MNPREDLQKLLDGLATQRDQLIVQAHLAKLEARDEWQDLERKLDDLRGRAEKAAVVAESSGKDVMAAAKLLAEEIGKGYERLRRLI